MRTPRWVHGSPRWTSPTPAAVLLLAVRTWAGTIVASVAFAATTLWFAADTAASQSSTAGLIMLGIPMYGWIPSAVVAAVERRLAVDHR